MQIHRHLLLILTLLLLNVSVQAPPKKQPAAGISRRNRLKQKVEAKEAEEDLQKVRRQYEEIGGYLEPAFYKKNPTNNAEFDAMLDRAVVRLASIGNAMIASIEKALHGRTLAYVRLIGPGSMSFHLELYNYKKAIAAGDRNNFLQDPPDIQNGLAKEFQIKAVYQVALLTMIMDHFNKITDKKLKADLKKKMDNLKKKKKRAQKKALEGHEIAKEQGQGVHEEKAQNIHGIAKEKAQEIYGISKDEIHKEKAKENVAEIPSPKPMVATVEDIYLDINPLEMDFLRSRHILPIPVERHGERELENLEKIPEELVPKKEQNEVTLVMMFMCPINMTKILMEAYEKSQDGLLKNLILMESNFADPTSYKEFIDKYRAKFAHQLEAFSAGDKMAKQLFDEFTYIYYNTVGGGSKEEGSSSTSKQ